MPVPRWKCVFGMGLLMSSFLHVFCLPSTLAIHILASSARFCPSLCCLRSYTTRAKHLVLLGCYLERKRTLLHCSVMPVLTLAILLWRSKWDSDFLFLLAFILPQCYMWDFSGIIKADECAKTAAYRAAVLLNSMPNLFFKHPERLFFYRLPRETVPLLICFL